MMIINYSFLRNIIIKYRDLFFNTIPSKLHQFLVQKTKEFLTKQGFKVDDSSSKLALAFNEGRVDIKKVENVGEPDLIAVKGNKVLVVDIVIGTWAHEIVTKIKKYGQIGKVVFVFPAGSFDDVEFWSLNELGISEDELKKF